MRHLSGGEKNHSDIRINFHLFRAKVTVVYLLKAHFEVTLSLLLVVWKGLIDQKLLINMRLLKFD